MYILLFNCVYLSFIYRYITGYLCMVFLAVNCVYLSLIDIFQDTNQYDTDMLCLSFIYKYITGVDVVMNFHDYCVYLSYILQDCLTS